MKIKNIVTVLLVAFILASCAPAAKVVPTETIVSATTFTSIPPTSTITPTPIPTIDIEGQSIPDPHFTNPELFDLQNPKSPIPQFIKAMSMAGIEISPENVIQQITYQKLTQANGKPYIVGLYNLDPDSSKTGETLEGEIPLLLAFQDNNDFWVWKKTTIGNFSNMIAINSGTLLEGAGSSMFETLEKVETENFNYGMVTTHQGLSTAAYTYDYGYSDVEIDMGVKSKMPLMSHMLVWSSVIPDWLASGNYSDKEIMEIMTHWITTTMKRYPQIKVWEVVNEAYNNDFFQRKLGDDYIVEFYKIARNARPDADLIYNDYSNHSTIDTSLENGQRTLHTIKIIEKLKKENLIDGVGVEMVIYADKLPPTYADITSTLKSYGIPVYVTEFAVIMTNVSGSKEQRWLKQADIYYGIVRAVLESKVCNTIIYFNQTDTNSPWEIQKELYEYSVNADPTLFDDNFNPKPAYYAVIQALYKPLP